MKENIKTKQTLSTEMLPLENSPLKNFKLSSTGKPIP